MRRRPASQSRQPSPGMTRRPAMQSIARHAGVLDRDDPAAAANAALPSTGVPPNPRAGQLLGVSGTTNVDYTYRVWYKLWLGTTTRTCGTVI
jgi:hypothetical protein